MGRVRYISVVVAVMVVLPLLITSGTASAAPSSPAKAAATAQTFTVSSTTGWQQTSLYLTAGQKFKVQYVSGCWTVDYRNFPCVGPQGYSSQEDAKIYQDCKYDGNNNYGVLYGIVGQVANGAFPIGSGGTFTAVAPGTYEVGAGNSGYLYLRINDTCLTDNAGSVTMRLSIIPPPPSCSTPSVSFKPSSGPVFLIKGRGWVPGGRINIALPHGFHTASATPKVNSAGDWQTGGTVGNIPKGHYTFTFTEKTPGCPSVKLVIKKTFRVLASQSHMIAKAIDAAIKHELKGLGELSQATLKILEPILDLAPEAACLTGFTLLGAGLGGVTVPIFGTVPGALGGLELGFTACTIADVSLWVMWQISHNPATPVFVLPHS